MGDTKVFEVTWCLARTAIGPGWGSFSCLCGTESIEGNCGGETGSRSLWKFGRGIYQAEWVLRAVTPFGWLILKKIGRMDSAGEGWWRRGLGS